MQWLREVYTSLADFAPTLGALTAVVLILWFADWLLLRRGELGEERKAPRQLGMLVLTALGLTLIVIVLPVSDETQGQLLRLLGLVFTATIGLASTTFVANAMAGLMLRMVKSYRPGDFVRVGDEFGRITERGLFHTEIQTEDRDLTTLPNMYLVNHPITVVRSSGTIISCRLSLGYDEPRNRVETLLVDAGLAAGLEEPFVQVMELGDFAITYRVAGFLPKVKHLLTARSTLRKRVLDELHGAGVEVMSPTFMSQRRVDDTPIIPEPLRTTEPEVEDVPETRIFDKAEVAAQLTELREDRARIAAEIAAMKTSVGGASDEHRDELKARLAHLDIRIKALEKEAPEA